MQSFGKKGQAGGIFAVFGIAVMALLVVVVVLGGVGWATGMFSAEGGFTKDDKDTEMGVPVESLAVMQVNAYTDATEGGDDLEFWDLGKDITNSKYSARETIDLSSGAATDTTVPAMRSTDNQDSKDLYIEGAGNYYDEYITEWSIQYNKDTGKGVLAAKGPSGAVVATDIGTFEDIDTVSELDTGFGQQAAGTVNYSITTGSDGGYIKFNIGNSEADSELRDVVICITDADKDLEGDEITTLTLSHVSGENFNINTDLTTLFDDAAGSGGAACTTVGTIEGDKVGEYKLQMSITEANFGADEEFEIVLDDLGDAWAKDYPSRNAKATAEDLTITRVA